MKRRHKTEFFRLNYAVSECSARGWAITPENVRALDCLGVDEVIDTCRIWSVNADGTTPESLNEDLKSGEDADEWQVSSNTKGVRRWPGLRQAAAWPWLGRRRRVLEILRHSNSRAAELRRAGLKRDGIAPETSILSSFFEVRQNSPTLSLPKLREHVREAVSDLPGEVVAEVLHSIGTEQPLAERLIVAWAYEALERADVSIDVAQVVAALAEWKPLSEQQIYGFVAAQPDADVADDVMITGLGQSLEPISALCLGCYFLLELDTEEIADTLRHHGNHATRGAVQSLINNALFQVYKERSEGGAKHRLFMGPVVAAEPGASHDNATMMRLTYHLGAREDRKFLAEHLAHGVKEALATRVSEYARKRVFEPLWDAERSGGVSPTLPGELKPLIDGFYAADNGKRSQRTQKVREFFTGPIPMHPDDVDTNGRTPGRPEQIRTSNPKASDALRPLFVDSHITPTELSVAARLGTEGLSLLRDHIAAHIAKCDDCAHALRLAQSVAQHQATQADYLDSLGRPPDLAGGWPSSEATAIRPMTPDELRNDYAQLLAEAEQMVEKIVVSGAFERWRSGRIVARQDTVTPRIAASSGPVSLDVPHAEDAQYRLIVEVLERPARPVVDIRCASPVGPPEHWGFRLVFDPEKEAGALGEMGLSSLHLGALRLAYGLEHEQFAGLLDLLLPFRYGSNRDGEDPAFSTVLQDGRVEGKLPGAPTGFAFWVT